MSVKMSSVASLTKHQSNLFGYDLLTQLDSNDPLIALANTLAWNSIEERFCVYDKEEWYHHRSRSTPKEYSR